MDKAPESLVEIGTHFGDGYKPVLDFHGWRVAMLRYSEGKRPEAFHRVDRHNATNEVFILTTGEANLVVMDGGDVPTDGYVLHMRPNVAYNVQQAVWHHVVMSEDAHIVLVERTDTSRENSEAVELPEEVVQKIRRQFTLQL
jgi:ureidoglycolate hydrolase